MQLFVSMELHSFQIDGSYQERTHVPLILTSGKRLVGEVYGIYKVTNIVTKWLITIILV